MKKNPLPPPTPLKRKTNSHTEIIVFNDIIPFRTSEKTEKMLLFLNSEKLFNSITTTATSTSLR